MQVRRTIILFLLVLSLPSCTRPDISRPTVSPPAISLPEILRSDVSLMTTEQPERRAALYYEIYNLRSNCTATLNGESLNFSMFFDGIINVHPRKFLEIATTSESPLTISEIGDFYVVRRGSESNHDAEHEVSFDFTLNTGATQYRGLMAQQYRDPLTGHHIFDANVAMVSTTLYVFPYSPPSPSSSTLMRQQAQSASIFPCSTVRNRQ